LFFLFQLAEHLHKSIGEIMLLPLAEIQGWAAYFKIKLKENKK